MAAFHRHTSLERMRVHVVTDVLMDGQAPGLRCAETGAAAGRALPLGHLGLKWPDWALWPPDLLAQIFVLLQTLTLGQVQTGQKRPRAALESRWMRAAEHRPSTHVGAGETAIGLMSQAR